MISPDARDIIPTEYKLGQNEKCTCTYAVQMPKMCERMRTIEKKTELNIHRRCIQCIRFHRKSNFIEFEFHFEFLYCFAIPIPISLWWHLSLHECVLYSDDAVNNKLESTENIEPERNFHILIYPSVCALVIYPAACSSNSTTIILYLFESSFVQQIIIYRCHEFLTSDSELHKILSLEINVLVDWISNILHTPFHWIICTWPG